MKHIGIVAHSAEGAALCYGAMCREGFRLLGEHQHPEITMSSIPMGRSMPFWESADLLPIAELLLAGITRVHAAGADFVVVPDNTAHLALPLIAERMPIPLLHIAEVVCDRASAEARRKVAVLGTRFTMDGPVYRRALAARQIEHAIPGEPDRHRINRIIFDELVNGVITASSRAFFVNVIRGLQGRGCDAVILGCTEIPLLLGAADSPLPVLDSTRLLACAAVAHAVEFPVEPCLDFPSE